MICKATFALAPGESRLADHQEPILDLDSHWEDDVGRSLRVPSDLVPHKARADVLLVGSAYAPQQIPVAAVTTRLLVGEVDKSVEVQHDRWIRLDGTLLEGARFARMPLFYERAGGGPDTTNPVGVRAGAVDPMGRVRLPNLVRPGVMVRSGGEVVEPVGFGPLSPAWSQRRDRLGGLVATFVPARWYEAPLPDDLDPAFFNAAPRDQQLDFLPANARIVLEHLHPAVPRFVTSLPGIQPLAVVEGRSGGPQTVALSADTLWIDTDRLLCTLTYRARIPLRQPEEQGRVVMTTRAPSSSSVEIEPTFNGDGGEEDEQSTVAPPVQATSEPPRSASSRYAALPFMRGGPGAPEGSPESSSMQARNVGLPFMSAEGVPAQMLQTPPALDVSLAPASTPDAVRMQKHTMVFAQVPPPGAQPAPSAPSRSVPPVPGAVAGMHAPPPMMPGMAPPLGAAPAPGLGASPLGAPPMSAPPMSAPPMSAPPLNAPAVNAPAVSAPPMSVPPMNAPPMSAPPMSVPPLSVPPLSPAPSPAMVAPPAFSAAAPAPPPMASAPLGGFLGGSQESALGVAPMGAGAGERGAGFAAAPPAWVPASTPSWSPSPRPPEPAGVPAHDARAALGGLSAASDAAATPLETPPSGSGAGPAPRPRLPPPSEYVDLLWFDERAPQRVRQQAAWASYLRETARTTEWLTGEEAVQEPQATRDRREVARALARVPPLDAFGVTRAVEESIDEDGILTRPLVVVGGELTMSFDPLEALKTTITVASQLTAADKKLKDAVDAASEVVQTRAAGGPLVEGASTRIRQAFAQMNRTLPADYLDATVQRTLIEERRYQRRTVLGGVRLCAALATGSGAPLPVYLPEMLADKLPLFPKFRVRAVAEPHAQQDPAETEPLALLVLALGRALPVPGGRGGRG
ncbi:DUF2169 family type VI secretion system accessory protein [Chondromyces apiculatus]|uniref:DUF2169 family type VI secretion system accessory protein n=1 Tax=Chondromyces apiculatus TaxID=51 RepID=UPI0018CC4911|nr:DUF2169 domain-containing protein [Chondromyces apiculatus]